MCHCRPMAEPAAKRGLLELSLSLLPLGMGIYRNQPLSIDLFADKFLDSQSAIAFWQQEKASKPSVSNQIAAKVAGSIGLTEV